MLISPWLTVNMVTSPGKQQFVGMRVTSISLLVLATTSVFTNATPGILLPLYSYPTKDGGSIWETVKKTATDNSVPVIAIINPNSGPGTSPDSVYKSAVDGLIKAKIKCIGYVPTDYSKVQLSTATANMDRYKSWYPQISGFFFDEMASSGHHESYYASLTSYAVAIGKTYTVGNPGTSTTRSYFATVNNTVIYETNGLPEAKKLDLGFPASGCSMIAYNVPGSSLNQSYINEIIKYVSLVYITDDVLDNPYDTVPSYYQQLLCFLSAAGSNTKASC